MDLLTQFTAIFVDGEMTTIAVPSFIENTEVWDFCVHGCVIDSHENVVVSHSQL